VTLIAKATCDLVQDGPAKIRPESALSAEDLAPFKVRADVTLTGHAHPAPGASVAEVALRFGREGNGFARRIKVFGDRRWQRTGGAPSISPPLPFDRMPLDHARAYGGPGHPFNPAGRGHDASLHAPARTLLPNLEDPDHPILSLAHAPEPACFAPIPASVREGLARLGPRRPDWPLFPEDFDWTRFQAAPRRQQLAFLEGGEPFTIEGARPRGAALRGTLPAVRARAFSRRTPEAGGAFEEIALHLDTAAFDADELTVSLVFRGVLPVDVESEPEATISRLYLVTENPSDPPASLAQARDALEAG
jgi:hypothetical protein